MGLSEGWCPQIYRIADGLQLLFHARRRSSAALPRRANIVPVFIRLIVSKSPWLGKSGRAELPLCRFTGRRKFQGSLSPASRERGEAIATSETFGRHPVWPRRLAGTAGPTCQLHGSTRIQKLFLLPIMPCPRFISFKRACTESSSGVSAGDEICPDQNKK